MAYKEITNEGKKFIRKVCNTSKDLLKGNNGSLPYSIPEQAADKIWTANVEQVNNNIDLSNILIRYYDKYAKEYELDANILAAQGYVESNYRVWAYNKTSDASGIVQFTMQTIYSVIISKEIQTKVQFSREEINKITKGLKLPKNITSYNPKLVQNINAKENRPILHQNIIDNLDIMIKAQAKYMRYIADKCDGLASAALFSYSRGPAYAETTYSKTIQNAKRKKGDGYIQEGLNYVIKIFGILGDPENKLSNVLSNKYKPINFSFGYFNNTYDGAPKDRLFNLNDKFNEFSANVSESDDYNIIEANVENLSITKQNVYPYKLLYFPEKQYKSGSENNVNKSQIVLHHTVSGPSVRGDVYHWQSNGEKVATAFLISREGEIYQLYNSRFWGIHIFYNEIPFTDSIKEFNLKIDNIGIYRKNMEKSSIGIELDSWGGLTKNNSGVWVNGNNKVVNNVQTYENGNFPGKVDGVNGYRGFYGFEKYTQKQINALGALLKSLEDAHDDITLDYHDDMWKFSKGAMNRDYGIWSHVSFRKDKSDCHPQPELIDMLKNLS